MERRCGRKRIGGGEESRDGRWKRRDERRGRTMGTGMEEGNGRRVALRGQSRIGVLSRSVRVRCVSLQSLRVVERVEQSRLRRLRT